MPTQTQQQEQSIEESIKQVMQTLPLPIQHYLGQGKYSVVVNRLMMKYGLRSDQGNILERETMLLLMGIENPEEFAASLTDEASISQDVVNKMLVDINQEIFIPLQEEMKKTAENAVLSAKPIEPIKPIQPVMPPPVVRQPVQEIDRTFMNPTPANPMLPRRPDLNQSADIKWVRPQQKVNIPAPSYTPTPIKREVPRPFSKPLEKLVNPVANEKLLEDHEEPSINFIKASTPARTAPPPPNLPGVISKVQPPPILPKIVPQAPVIAQPKPTPPAPPAKPYSTDPYREPIDTQ